MPQLPDELLALIFVECLPGGDPYVKPTVREAPLLLVLVCRQWKRIATQTAELWCSLSAVRRVVPWSDKLKPMRQGGLDGCATWLSRSGNRPLSLAIPFEAGAQQTDGWLGILIRRIARLQRLRVVDHGGLDLNLLLRGADMVQFLAIEARLQGSPNLTIAQAPPSLHTLVLDGLYAAPTTLPGPAWASLTQLAIMLPGDETYHCREFLDLVSRCPNLQTLAFGLLMLHGYDLTGHPGTHPTLRSITVFLTLEQPNLQGTSILIVPALLELRVLEYGGDPECLLAREKRPPALPPIPSERACVLTLYGYKGPFQLFDVAWMNLTVLEVKFSGDLDVLETALMLCSNLQTLTLSGLRSTSTLRSCPSTSTSFSAPFTHPNLNCLHITLHGGLGNLLQMATLPALEELEIRAFSFGRHDDLYNFLARSRCEVHWLKVRAGGIVWTAEEHRKVRALMPAVISLCLERCPSYESDSDGDDDSQ